MSSNLDRLRAKFGTGAAPEIPTHLLEDNEKIQQLRTQGYIVEVRDLTGSNFTNRYTVWSCVGGKIKAAVVNEEGGVTGAQG